jgi:hypothetical protein
LKATNQVWLRGQAANQVKACAKIYVRRWPINSVFVSGCTQWLYEVSGCTQWLYEVGLTMFLSMVQAYAAWMWGNLLLERESDWQEALKRFSKAK